MKKINLNNKIMINKLKQKLKKKLKNQKNKKNKKK